MAAPPQIVDFEEGWNRIQTQAIVRLERLMENNFEEKEKLLSNTEYMEVYTTCYTMCTQRPPNNFSDRLYTKHNDTIVNYLKNTVLPALEQKHDEFLLKELVTRWTNHNIMNKWMMKFFMYLDRYYVTHHNLKPLLEAGMEAFRKEVYEEVKVDVAKAILAIVSREREGEIIDTRRILVGHKYPRSHSVALL